MKIYENSMKLYENRYMEISNGKNSNIELFGKKYIICFEMLVNC